MLFTDLTPEVVPRRVARLAPDVLLMALSEGSVSPELLDVAPPYGTVSVRGVLGPHRIAAMRWRSGGPSLPGVSVPALSGESGPPELVSDAVALAEELDAASSRRLLGFLLGFCRTAFNLAGDRAFAATCARLARFCARVEGEAKPLALATPTWMVLSGVNAPQDATFFVIAKDRIRLSGALRIAGGPGLYLVEPLQGGEMLLAMSDRPLLWMVAPLPAELPDILSADRRGGLGSRLRNACLRALAPAGGVAAAVLRETQVLAPARARRLDDPANPIAAMLEAVLPDGEGSLFLRGWIRDPMHLVAGIEVRTPFGTSSVDPAQLHGIRRPDLGRHFAKTRFRDGHPTYGFVARVPDPSNGLCPQPSLMLRLRSGNTIELAAVACHLPPAQARDAVLSAVPPDQATAAIMDRCIAPAAAAMHRAALRVNRTLDCVQFGKPPSFPAVSIVVPLYRNLEFLRFQVAALARDPVCREAELIYVLDSPHQRSDLASLLRGLNALHGLSFTMAVMPENLGYAAANNAAAAIARGRELLLLNSDVVPLGTGCLDRLRAALTMSGVDAAGPKLLFDDGSIQHGGMYFRRDHESIWYNAHYHKGMPRRWPTALTRRKVPAVTGAALLVRRKVFEAVGGICEDYIIGDYEDSDFCLRLQAAGSAIAYAPDAELYHFERRSIQTHPGYAGTLTSLFNRRLHHARWDDAMTSLMAQRAFRVRP